METETSEEGYHKYASVIAVADKYVENLALFLLSNLRIM